MARLHLPGRGKPTKDEPAHAPADRPSRDIRDIHDGQDRHDRTAATTDRDADGTYGPGAVAECAAPDSPAELPKRSWSALLRRGVAELKDDELTDRAAALACYGILSRFPALLVLVSLLGIAGESATREVLDNMQRLAPGSSRDVSTDAVEQLQAGADLGSALAVGGLVGAVWSASGYVAAFIRAANAAYDVPEGRPVWNVLPLRVALTVVLLVLSVVSALTVVFTGALARQAGTALGVGDTGLAVWPIAKWPVLVLLVVCMIAILCWATPNARVKGFKWVSPGSVAALLIWLAASVGFAVYVTDFGSHKQDVRDAGGRHRLPGLAVGDEPADPPRPGARCRAGPAAGRRRRSPARRRTVRGAARHPAPGPGRTRGARPRAGEPRGPGRR